MRVAESIAARIHLGRLCWWFDRSGYLLVGATSIALWVAIISGFGGVRANLGPELIRFASERADTDEELATGVTIDGRFLRPGNISRANIGVIGDQSQVSFGSRVYTVTRMTGTES
ncbi:MAG: hypothetical protein KTR32_10835 [Granulosicoccus sp.]|nr:hypothetical protein [Granulosicoccus sp.]